MQLKTGSISSDSKQGSFMIDGVESEWNISQNSPRECLNVLKALRKGIELAATDKGMWGRK